MPDIVRLIGRPDRHGMGRHQLLEELILIALRHPYQGQAVAQDPGHRGNQADQALAFLGGRLGLHAPDDFMDHLAESLGKALGCVVPHRGGHQHLDPGADQEIP